MKILLVEDSRTSQQLAMLILEDEGHSVEVADNGLIAVEKFASSSFDLILMDVQMPEMDGLEATTRIREHEQSIDSRTLIIAMTADESPGDRDQCLESGMDDYISKPLDMNELAEALARAKSNGSNNVDQSDAKQPEASPTEPMIDWVGALEFVSGHQSILDTVVEAAIEEGPILLDQLRRAIESSDFEVIHRTAHTIKGAYRTFNPVPLIEVAEQIESLAQSESLDQITPLFSKLEPLLDLTLQELQVPPAVD